jgi:hypothetical protein
MGKIICEKHGEQGNVLACEHVRQDILTVTSIINCMVGEEVLDTFGTQPVGFRVGYCDRCASQYGLPLADGVLPDSASDFVDQTKPVCSACFEKLKESLRSCESA